LLSYVDSFSYLSFPVEPTTALREEARQAAETALTLQPDLGEAVLAEGYYYYAFLKDYDTAVSYFEQARPLLPNSSKIPEGLAYVARRRGQWDRSDAYFNEAERLDPRNVNLLTQHALLDIERRNFSLALRKLDYILDITPGDVDTLAYKAAVAQAEGDLPRASAMLDGLRPTADQQEALETQVYQAILKRQPAPMVRRLTEILASPDSSFGYINGELRFWLGWAQEVAGDKAAAQQSWRQARSELESFLNKQPDNISIIADLTWTNLALGDPSVASALAERAAATFPLEKDAINGSTALDIVARCAALRGDHDGAISVLQKLLSIPHTGALASGMPLTPALLRLDPMFDGLRNDPRFQKLVGAYPHE
jgi:serine/threonine-protein kinase